jgi:hypothetical protein
MIIRKDTREEADAVENSNETRVPSNHTPPGATVLPTAPTERAHPVAQSKNPNSHTHTNKIQAKTVVDDSLLTSKQPSSLPPKTRIMRLQGKFQAITLLKCRTGS